jgi:hypothetical protein
MKRLSIPTLPPREWVDKDYVLLHACFTVLVDYIEKEDPAGVVDYWDGTSQEAANAWQEMQALYRYWTKERPLLQDAVDSSVDLDDELVLYGKDNEMLHRLINVRSYMWT